MIVLLQKVIDFGWFVLEVENKAQDYMIRRKIWSFDVLLF